MKNSFSIPLPPTGNQLTCKGWHQEAALRCLLNNLHPDVAENREELVVYGGIGKAARNSEALNAIIYSLKNLGIKHSQDDRILPAGVYAIFQRLGLE